MGLAREEQVSKSSLCNTFCTSYSRAYICAVWSTFCTSYLQAYIFAHPALEHTFYAVWSTVCTSYSRAYILCCMEHFLHILLSSVHFVLYGALFAHPTCKRTFLHILLLNIHFMLYGALFAHPTLERTFCAVWSTFCTSYSRAYILCCMEHFLHILFLERTFCERLGGGSLKIVKCSLWW